MAAAPGLSLNHHTHTPTETSPFAGRRETRIDILRGMAMLIIAINHTTFVFRALGLQGHGIPTPTAIGYSTSASLFVVFSGYMVGMVYSGKPDATRTVLLRAGKLYIYNSALMLAVLPLILSMTAAELFQLDASFLTSNPLAAISKFILMVRAPALLDILQMYVMFLLLTPGALWLHRKSELGLVGVSAAVWFFSQVATASHLLDPKLVEYKFNPAAWQLLFFVPMVLGARRFHERLFHALESHKWIIAATGFSMAAFAISKVAHLERHFPGDLLFTSKGNLGALHLLHTVVAITFYCGLLCISRSILTWSVMRGLACVGRQTLYCYIASVWVAYASALMWSRLGGGYLTYLGAAVIALTVSFVTAALLDAHSAKGREKQLEELRERRTAMS